MTQATKRTDLAKEAVDLFRETSHTQNDPDGIRTEQKTVDGIAVYTVTVETDAGAEKLGRPIGRYVTVEADAILSHEENAFPRTVRVIAAEIAELLPPDTEQPIMVAGLGNRAVTPDALGPLVADKIIATRHLLSEMPDRFAGMRAVTVLTPGVLGMTGMESAEVICGVAEAVRPGALILIDALAARSTERLCRTVQIADTGITPGSGVGNRRFSIDRESVGVPCISIGVPTVVDVLTLAADLLEDHQAAFDTDALRAKHGQTFVTVKEIDRLVAECAKVIGFAVNAAAQPALTIKDIELFLA